MSRFSLKRKLPTRWRKFARRAAPGASPGTIIADPTAPKPRVTVIGYSADTFVECEVSSVNEIGPLLGKWPVIWVNVDGLGDAEVVSQLGEMFGLHRLALEDVVNVHQRAKTEVYDDKVFVVLREPVLNSHLEMDQISMFLGRDFVVTFQEKRGDCLEPVRDRIRKNKGRLCHLKSDYLAYALIDAVIDAYYPVLEQFGERLEELEDQTIEHPSRRTVREIHLIKREFLTIRRAVWPAREAVSMLIREELPNVCPDTKVFLRDCYDHLVQLIDMLETYRETGSDLMEVYLTSVSNRMNEIMKVLTIISTIFMPLSFIAGVYGMNFNTDKPHNMPELNWRYGYYFALAIMAAVTVTMLVFFMRRGWIGSDKKQR